MSRGGRNTLHVPSDDQIEFSDHPKTCLSTIVALIVSICLTTLLDHPAMCLDCHGVIQVQLRPLHDLRPNPKPQTTAISHPEVQACTPAPATTLTHKILATALLMAHHLPCPRMDAEKLAARHFGEVSCRDFRESVLHVLPHRWVGVGVPVQPALGHQATMRLYGTFSGV